MTRTQIIAARAARAGATPSTRPVGGVGTDLRARVTSTPLRTTTKSKRSKGRGLGASMPSGDGTGKSMWTASPYYFTDPAWSQTVSNPR